MHLPHAHNAMLSYSSRHHLSRVWQALLLGLLMASNSAVFALPSDQTKPVTLEADQASFNERTGVTSYRGNVIITQGTIRIEADQLTVNLDDNRGIKDAIAQGSPARFQQQLDASKGLAKGQGQNVTYNAQTGIVTLKGNAFLSQNGATFRGDTLRYSMNQGDIEATGNSKQRVQLVIPPSATTRSTSAKTTP
jgi:lipopolysaccharide export system protein LptA